MTDTTTATKVTVKASSSFAHGAGSYKAGDTFETTEHDAAELEKAGLVTRGAPSPQNKMAPAPPNKEDARPPAARVSGTSAPVAPPRAAGSSVPVTPERK